jgi:hypothetical protein
MPTRQAPPNSRPLPRHRADHHGPLVASRRRKNVNAPIADPASNRPSADCSQIILPHDLRLLAALEVFRSTMRLATIPETAHVLLWAMVETLAVPNPTTGRPYTCAS